MALQVWRTPRYGSIVVYHFYFGMVTKYELAGTKASKASRLGYTAKL